MNKTMITGTALVVLFILVIVFQASQTHSSQVQEVHVDNFPAIQNIRGSVSVEGTVSVQGTFGQAKSFKKEEIIVYTAQRNDKEKLTWAGTIETAGFSSITISLQGELKRGSFTAGTIGVLLIPAEHPIGRAFRDEGLIQFPIEVSCDLKSGGASFFEAAQIQKRIAFPRYNMYLYNTTDKPVDANVYLYLSN